MHFSPLFIALASAYLTRAASLADIPGCAKTPVENGFGASKCTITDLACVCSAPAFISGILPEIKTACSAADEATFISLAQSLCESAGVTIAIPSGVPTASTSNISSTASDGATLRLPVGELVLPTVSAQDATSTLAMGPVVLPLQTKAQASSPPPNYLPPPITSPGAGASASTTLLLLSSKTRNTTVFTTPTSTISTPVSATTTKTTTIRSTLTRMITHVSASYTNTSSLLSPPTTTTMPSAKVPYPTGNASAMMANSTNQTAMTFRGAASGRDMGAATVSILAVLMAGTMFL